MSSFSIRNIRRLVHDSVWKKDALDRKIVRFVVARDAYRALLSRPHSCIQCQGYRLRGIDQISDIEHL